ncbi:MAG: transglycosylase SLT domain-containing protein [Litorilinea sp.]
MQQPRPDAPPPEDSNKRKSAPTNPLLETWTVWEQGTHPSPAAAQPRAADPLAYSELDSAESESAAREIEGEALPTYSDPQYADSRYAASDLETDFTTNPDIDNAAGADFTDDDEAGEILPDVVDGVLIGRLGMRQIAVEPGDAATLSLSLLNNGTVPAVFALQVEGWVDEAWFPDLPQDLTLEPGVWTTLAVAIAPPFASHSWAGTHPFALTIHSPQHPDRHTRLGATLTIAPFADFAVAGPVPDFVESKGRGRAASAATANTAAITRVQVTNRGNQTARYRVWGVCSTPTHRPETAPRCDFAFRAAGATHVEHDWLEIELEPDETRAIACRIAWSGMPPISPFAQTVPFRIVVEPGGEGRPARQMVAGTFEQRPLVGVWLLTALLSLVLGAVVFAAIVGVMAIVALQNGATQSPAESAAPVVAPAVEQPVFAIMLHMEEPLPPRAGLPNPAAESQGTGAIVPAPGPAIAALPAGQVTGRAPLIQLGDVTAPSARSSTTSAPDAPPVPAAPVPADSGLPAEDTLAADGALPVVQADQVSAPGALPPVAGPAAQNPDAVNGAQVNPQPAAEPVAASPAAVPRMTYAQMFQDVGMRFDLDWRMLAAQAYIESGFDALALGNLGSMGLMQIQPATWREWAPTLNAVDPFDSYSNALVAGVYLDYLRSLLASRGYPQTEWMLVAYNWGPDKLLDFLEAGGDWAGLPPEVRGYAEDVLRIARTLPATN